MHTPSRIELVNQVEKIEKALWQQDFLEHCLTYILFQVSTLKGAMLTPDLVELEGTLEQIEKGGYKHFMIKEIMEQPTSLENCMRGRVSALHY